MKHGKASYATHRPGGVTAFVLTVKKARRANSGMNGLESLCGLLNCWAGELPYLLRLRISTSQSPALTISIFTSTRNLFNMAGKNSENSYGHMK